MRWREGKVADDLKLFSDDAAPITDPKQNDLKRLRLRKDGQIFVDRVRSLETLERPELEEGTTTPLGSRNFKQGEAPYFSKKKQRHNLRYSSSSPPAAPPPPSPPSEEKKTTGCLPAFPRGVLLGQGGEKSKGRN